MRISIFACLGATMLAAVPLAAQDTNHPGNVVIAGTLNVDGITRLDDKVCIGNTCGFTESIGTNDLIKLKYIKTSIYFNDTSGGTDPSGDWRLLINDNFATTSGGIDRFSVEHVNAGTIPFTIVGNAPENALWVSSSGDIGLGTSLPQAKLHVSDGTAATILLDKTGAGGGTPYGWMMRGDEHGFAVVDQGTGIASLIVSPGAPTASLLIDPQGSVGLGTQTPATGSALHVKRSNGTAKALIEETNATAGPRTLLEMVNNGRPEIIMANASTGNEWSFGAGTNFVLKTGAQGSSDAAKTRHLKLYGTTGNLEITGSIITGGPTCGAGCDAVFGEDYDLPSIREHAAQMYALGHLPNVGPTSPESAVNLTDYMGNMLNELEHAHIYVAQQEERIAALEAMVQTLMAERAAGTQD